MANPKWESLAVLVVSPLQLFRFYSAYSSINSNKIKPEVAYSNAELSRSDILAVDLNTICVYRWVNNLNGNMYVGSSINLRIRLYPYYDKDKLSKSSRIIDRALLKYGHQNFSFEILEYCTKENVIKREQYYLDLFKPVYNIVEKAGSTLGYKHTDLTLAKMKEIQNTEEVRSIKRLSVLKAGESNRVKVIIVNIKTLEKKEYYSMTEAAEALGVHRNNIGNSIKNKRIIQKTFIACVSNELDTISDKVRLANLKQEEKKAGASSKDCGRKFKYAR
uniref:GIY-YIG endonuclease n=1 Tax=Juglanconis juglandina TaxID=1940567 RepID=A0A291LIU2_9PEZI|nr:GIY-YIG endonuclease [Juglanconis juglandina]